MAKGVIGRFSENYGCTPMTKRHGADESGGKYGTGGPFMPSAFLSVFIYQGSETEDSDSKQNDGEDYPAGNGCKNYAGD
jgi:hypothetical protein